MLNRLYRVTITIDHTKLSADVAQFPILVKLPGWIVERTSDSGSDVLFTDLDGNILPFFREKHDKLHNACIYHVLVSNISSSTDTQFYVYFGGGDLEDHVKDYQSVFGPVSQVAFWPLDGNANDLSGNYNGTWSGTEQYNVGIVDQAGDFNGSSYIQNNFSLSGLSEVAFSFWLSFGNGSNTNISNILGFSGSSDMAIEVINGTTARVYFRSNLNYTDIANFYINDSSWHLYTISIDSSGTKHYRDGQLIGSSGQTLSPVSSPFSLGGVTDNSGTTYYYTGLLDQVRIFSVLPDENYLTLLMNNEAQNLLLFSSLQIISTALHTILYDNTAVQFQKQTKLFAYDPDTKELLNMTTTDTTGKANITFNIPQNQKVLLTAAYEDASGNNEDMAGAWFQSLKAGD